MEPESWCRWSTASPEMQAYHDEEWGFPSDDDRHLFEKVSLEAFQCGLSWAIVLARRERLREVFANFEIVELAGFTTRDIDRIASDPTIIRHRGKIAAVIDNARACATLIEETGTLSDYLWSFAPGEVHDTKQTILRSKSPESDRLSKDLKRRGWKFVGPTTVYSMMQSVGMVNDHDPKCPVRMDVDRARQTFTRTASGIARNGSHGLA